MELDRSSDPITMANDALPIFKPYLASVKEVCMEQGLFLKLCPVGLHWYTKAHEIGKVIRDNLE